MSGFFVSDCGQYVARENGNCCFDIMTIDGSKMWLDNRNKDNNKFPEFENMFTGYSLIKANDSYSVWIFELSFADLDQSKKIDPYSGNCIIKKYTATFRRRIKFRTPKKIFPDYRRSASLKYRNLKVGEIIRKGDKTKVNKYFTDAKGSIGFMVGTWIHEARRPLKAKVVSKTSTKTPFSAQRR